MPARKTPATKPSTSARAETATPAVALPKADKAAPAKAAKPAKLRRKPVRDSFTMPEADFAVIGTLKSTGLSAGRAAKKSELLRAGLHALAKLDAKALVAALDDLEPVKTGRPKKNH